MTATPIMILGADGIGRIVYLQTRFKPDYMKYDHERKSLLVLSLDSAMELTAEELQKL